MSSKVTTLRSQVDHIDMQSQTDSKFKFVCVCQDHPIKIVIPIDRL